MHLARALGERAATMLPAICGIHFINNLILGYLCARPRRWQWKIGRTRSFSVELQVVGSRVRACMNRNMTMCMHSAHMSNRKSQSIQIYIFLSLSLSLFVSLIVGLLPLSRGARKFIKYILYRGWICVCARVYVRTEYISKAEVNAYVTQM